MAYTKKTHCKNGHEFTEENTRILANGSRVCRACKREWARENTGLKGHPKNNKNQNTDKTHCVRGHEFTEENTYWKGERRICIICRNEAQRKSDARYRAGQVSDPVSLEKYRKRRRRSQLKPLGWTMEMFSEAHVAQEGKCAICQKPIHTNKNDRTTLAHADHKHVSPPIPRGLLCQNCNLGIGNLQDNPELLMRAAEYIRRYENAEQLHVENDRCSTVESRVASA